VTEPDHDSEAVDEFIDPKSGARMDAKTGEIL
jgi:transposase